MKPEAAWTLMELETAQEGNAAKIAIQEGMARLSAEAAAGWPNHIARIERALASDLLKRGLKSDDPKVRRVAREQRRLLREQLKKLKGEVK